MTYDVRIEPDVHALRDELPGSVRQRIRRAISDFAKEPRPAGSAALDVSGLEVPDGIEARRLRLDAWRIVYAIHDGERWVWVLGVRQRPPYDYGDLAALVGKLKEA